MIIEKGGRMNATRYLEIVKKYFLPFYRRIQEKYSSDIVIQEDNTSWYTAKVVRAYLDKQGVKRL